MNDEKVEYSYICDKCGYKAVKMGKLDKCPLCNICPKCGKPVKDCTCIEGE